MDDLSQFHDSLIDWFQKHKEDLPWRRTSDPYAIWISEIMLQQTQVATVIPYYERFMSLYPDVASLADAPLDDVLKQWEGLGYYSRARNLHRAAKMVVSDFGGVFPSTVQELRTLPGVGAYTAGAVASLAFGQDAPVLDGNIMRIFARLFDISDDVRSTTTKNAMWKIADDILPEGSAAAWNEGLMELGRLVCTPRNPACHQCPFSAMCTAYLCGVQAERPVRSKKAPTPHYDVTAAVIYGSDERILVAQRPLDGMLGGLWEFPGGKREKGESLQECLRREIREELDIDISVGAQVAVIRHAYTHFRITLYAFVCEHTGGEPRAVECADWAWTTLDGIDRFAFAVTDQKIISALRNGGQPSLELDPL